MKKTNYQNWSKEKLIEKVKALEKRKKYGLVWEEKPEEVVEMCKDKLPVLKEVKSKEIITDKNKPVNLLIEGDNYHALSVLNYTHAGKIDVIYIDPPYNTGNNKEWKFNDHWVDKEDAYRHSKWLSFIKKRLKLAKSLLRETGVIFISIDDNEVAQLKSLCDDIFGGQNFIEQIIWKNKYGAGAKTRGFISIHEYILCYSKNPLKDIQAPLGKSETRKHNKKDDKYEIRGGYRTQPLATKSLGDRPNLVYPVIYKGQEIWPDKQWVWSKGRMEKAIKNGEVEFTLSKDGKYSIRAKQYLRDEDGNMRMGKPLSIIEDYFTQEGTEELTQIFRKNVFSFPKPKNLIKHLIGFYINGELNKEAAILDFMAGSGTSAHAVLELNKEDGGNRQFILCTNNENNICTDVCYPRIKKVIEGYKNLKGEKVAGLNGNLKYFRADKNEFVDAEPTDRSKLKLTQRATEMLCIKEGTFTKVLDQKKFKIFRNHNHYTGIILDQLAIPAFKKAIKNIKGKFSIYVFSLSDETFDEEFADIKQKIKLSPIPETILRVYRRIFK